ncbi:hypothetical protein PR202_ga16462 [Eleusine coracana subsp. coracana]|uniref:Uncharacterized protein n=1 Tax=Eleusine coracana subsp. coracana TaxID=191504 RepID=A0AAV5CMV5_ELECO|nr:hypothetical protein PR202_ga16462 [Eleusine coracana subsp. coracana]
MMLQMNGGAGMGSDYGSSEAGSYEYDEEGEEDYEEELEHHLRVHHHEHPVRDGEGEGEDAEGAEGSDYEEDEEGEPEVDPAEFEDDEAYARALQDAEEREVAARLMALAGLSDWRAVDVEHDEEHINDPQVELVALGEVVGTESRGLSADTLASLPSVTYKTKDVQDGNTEQTGGMAYRPEDMRRSMARPSNPWSQLAPSFPTPAINNLLQDNNELVSRIAAPQHSSYLNLFGGTVPQYGTNPFRQGGGAGRIHSSAVAQPPDAAALAALNNFESRPLQPNGHIMGWPLGQPHGPLTQQQVPRFPGPQPIGPSGSGVWVLLPRARDTRFTQQQPAGVVEPYPYGSGAGAPPVGSYRYRYGGPSWSSRPAGPAYRAGNGRPAQTRVASKPTKSLEEFLREQGIPIPIAVDELLDDTDAECDAMVAELLGNPAEEPGQMESGAGVEISVERNWLLPPAVGFGSGPNPDQLGLGTVGVLEPPPFGAGVVDGCNYGQEAAAAAREGRRKKMAEEKVAAAKARARN